MMNGLLKRLARMQRTVMKHKGALSPFVAEFFEFKPDEGVIEVEFTREEKHKAALAPRSQKKITRKGGE